MVAEVQDLVQKGNGEKGSHQALFSSRPEFFKSEFLSKVRILFSEL